MSRAEDANLLAAVDGADPCGEALDYDLDYLEFEIAARGKPDRQLGDATAAGDATDWIQVAALGLELARRSKDLRIGATLTRAWLHTDGFRGLADGLALLADYLERYWDGVHPRPDADDADDPTVRVNALANLCDPAGLLADIRHAPLADSRAFGRFSLEQWQAARNDEPGSGAPDLAQIEGAFGATDRELLSGTSEALGDCLGGIGRLEASLRAQIAPEAMLRLDALKDLLGQVRAVIDAYRPMPSVGADEAAEEVSPVATGGSGEISSRADVIGQLERICVWYRANEPSSPVPMLLERTKRLVAKDFLSLLVELAPEGAEQFRHLAGISDAITQDAD
ncbi:type VI secretion system protein TssA [Arenibaculum pallidiluteum]|uniref:type VI secretion system protein TssA n=1 Tax=Arenibaculum pallidiluteum TaxID=2812559 RepID=UPI001A9682B5|nr:type VI secretion system protein TssA [Arenibaculum pallidiluteum]